MDSQEKTILELSESIETQTKVILEYETKKDTSGKDETELQKDVVEKTAEIADLKNALAKKTTEFEQLAVASREGASKDQVDDYDKRIRELTEKVIRVTESLDAEKAKLSSVEENYQQTTAELTETKLLLSKKDRDFDELKSKENSESETREDEFKLLSSQIQEQKAEIDKMKTQLESKQKIADHYKEKFEQSKKQTVEFSTALSASKSDLEDLKGSNSGAVDDLSGELTAVKQQNAKLKAELEKAKANPPPGDGITLNHEELERLRSLLKTARAQIHGLKFQLAHGDKIFEESSGLTFEERETTKSFISVILKRLGVPEDKFPTYIARWKDGMGGEFCKVSARVRSLVESTQWPKIVLEMVPAQNAMIKAEIEAFLKLRKEQVARQQPAARPAVQQPEESGSRMARRAQHERSVSNIVPQSYNSPQALGLSPPTFAKSTMVRGPIIAATPTQRALLSPAQIPAQPHSDGRQRRQTISVSNGGYSPQQLDLLPPAIAKQQKSPKK
jgi:myosin heavy subunit